MSQISAEELANIASLNSVSAAALQADGSYVRDFTGNDLAYAHTVEEVERKKFSTQPELNDKEMIDVVPGLEAASATAATAEAQAFAAKATAALSAGWVETTDAADIAAAERVTEFPSTVEATTVVKFNGKYYKKTVAA